MATTILPPDFKEFLKLLNANQIEYLLIGGYAVGYHGYVRATADMDVWVRIDPKNADRLVVALRQFGFDVPALAPELFLQANRIVRMGVPPFRIEVHTSISGVEFEEATARHNRWRRCVIDQPGRSQVQQEGKRPNKGFGRP